MLLENILNSTDEYLNSKNKSDRKKIGQFFTSKETAIFMAGLSNYKKRNIKILDAGAGTGILSIALLEKLKKEDFIQNIEIDLYENDLEIIPILEKNMIYAKEKIGKLKKYNIIKENFILNNSEVSYDIIISNPPYKKIRKNDIESKVMSEVIYGQPNLYFLFMAKAIKLLANNGEMIFIVPRSWTSGAYFKKFRQIFLDSVRITDIHLFISRDKVFNKENVLQETMILKAIKTKEIKNTIHITQSYSNEDFEKLKSYDVAYDICIEKDNERYVYLPVDHADIETLKTINSFHTKLEDIGLKLKTGLTVDFRNEEYLTNNASNNSVPLFSSIHFDKGFIKFPSKEDEQQYVSKDNTALLQKNTNSLFIKRFSSKEENRRIQPVMYFKKDFANYEYISTENHINFIGSIDKKDINEDVIYGLYGIYNSTLYDKYYRILNGSTQVNATEINNIPIPNENTIKNIGKRLQEKVNITTEICDNVLLEAISNE